MGVNVLIICSVHDNSLMVTCVVTIFDVVNITEYVEIVSNLLNLLATVIPPIT